MIHSMRATAGYAASLPALKDCTFEFEDGLTVLFGPNACGKSTMLKLLAAYSGCQRPGWTTYSEDYRPMKPYVHPQVPNPPYPERFTAYGMGGLRAEVQWDGTPTYYSSGLPSKGQASFEEAMERGGDEADDYMRRTLSTGSSGQEQIRWVNDRLEQAIEKPPTIARDATFYVYGRGMVAPETRKHWGTDWSDGIGQFVDYVDSLPRTGPVTVLLDEPDVRLSIPNAQKLWSAFLPRIAQGRQLIVASHSPFALLTSQIVDMEPGYSDRCRKALASLPGA